MDSLNLIEEIKKHFENDSTFVIEKIKNTTLFFLKGSSDTSLIVEMIVRPLIESNTIYATETKNFTDLKSTITALIGGHALLIDEKSIILINCQQSHFRSIQEPDNEMTINGGKDGFIESMITNIALVRQKLPNANLKFKHMTLGTDIKTNIAIGYLEGKTEASLITMVEERLRKITLEGIYDAHYIIELIKDNRRSFFNTLGETERPDTFCAKLLEGGIGIIINGSPCAILAPFLFVENFKANDDYYSNFYYATFTRILRYIAFFLTIIAPALYISLVGFHHELLPSFLAINIAASTSAVPLGAVMECILFITLFELLRESGLRMPSKVGQALSIVGAIIIGQAAVEAKIVSPAVIIIVSITAVTGFMVPKMNTVVVFLRFFTLIAACFFGIYGIIAVFLIFMTKLFSIDVFNVQYSGNFFELSYEKIKDSLIRAPFDKFDKNKELKQRK